MNTLPLVSSCPTLLRRLQVLFTASLAVPPEIVPLTSTSKAIEYLNMEMPDLILIDFADPKVNGIELLTTLLSDPWLHHGGIIALSKSSEMTRMLEEHKGANLIAILEPEYIDTYLPRVLSIVEENRRVLFQHEIGSDFVENMSGSFRLQNNLLEARCYINLVCNFLYNANRIDLDHKMSIALSLTEMLINAIEHGNCGINFEDKSRLLETGGNIEDLIAEKCRDQDINARRVLFEFTLSAQSARFAIGDEGAGFDWRHYMTREHELPENLYELHGRGIVMTRSVAKNLQYNERGNEVTFEVLYQKNAERKAPGLFANIEPRSVTQGDIIFRAGETSDYLYFIAKGEFDVIVNDQIVSILKEDDLFMGEMSFLLNNRRSATIRARSEGKLIEVSKKNFVEAIKRKPHYALFLSRLLAQRIQRLNEKSSKQN